MIDYESDRVGLLAPSYAEDDAMRIENGMKAMYHHNVKEEDYDSDDNTVEAGKIRTMRILNSGLQELMSKRVSSKSPRRFYKLIDNCTPADEARERTRRNSTKESELMGL